MTKVADAVADTKENPRMFGINIVFLIMSILSLLVLLLGIFGCKERLIPKKTVTVQEDLDIKNPNQEMTTKDITEIEIVIDEKEKPYDNISINTKSDSSTIVDDTISIDDSSSIRDKSDADTITENDNPLHNPFLKMTSLD